MSKEIVLVFSLIGLFSVCAGQIVQDGQCASLPIQENFDIERFLGKWYEYARIDNSHQQGDCSAFDLTNSDGLEIYHSSVNNNFFEEGTGTVSQVGNTARLTVSISSFQDPIDFSVLETDDEYSVFGTIFSCEDISSDQRRVHIWVFTRSTDALNPMVPAFIDATLIKTFGIELSTLRSSDHSEATCYVLPVIEPGNPIIFPGQCDLNLPVVQNFEVDKFLGLWHQISSYESPNGNGACVRAEYTQGVGVVNIVNSHVVDQNVLTIDGYASVSGTDAKLSVVLNIPGAPPTPQELWILRTDYDNYAIAYTCVNLSPTQRRVFSWILGRTRRLSPTVETAVNEAMRPYLDLNSAYYIPTDQSDAGCFFYPEPTDQPVIFRGQCESVNVQAMPNFEADRYMGTWHNIEMYPSRFQDGTCSNAFYELVDGQVAVINSQVKDQRLETVRAVATPAGDGSAKLAVTFPGQSVSIDYWILDTDYSNYAFVYTCQNIDANEMQVGSWKLSKTKQLSQQSELAINAIISSVQYLHEQYYKKVDQTAGSCFYFPEAEDNVPVVFPGQCDDTVTVVQNLNFADLEGIWYEIESYPKAERTGQCINHQFTFVDNARLNMISSSVSDQFLGQLNGIVTRSSATDTSGKLIIAITNANGEVKNIPFWVLAVNNNDFAFAYACENIDDDFRAVWSWKLSRTRQLSTEGSAAIIDAIAKVDVLRDDYYENIQQTDAACFHLPDITPGDNVVLPGRCDTNIVGMPNFNINEYSGEWRLIESYGSRYQSGTCNVAQYTSQADNVLGITNSQVVNGQLASISGTATLSSTDGSGRLTFNLRNREYIMYILETDYNSFALAYGCTNLDNEQRRVTSWKFSRTNVLSQHATNRINEIINDIEVLHQPYYYPVNRSPDACFYFPEPDINTPVRFRGQCDDSIPVVPNFDVERYMGLWHDIESYPVVFQNGECPNAQYAQLDSNTVSVYNTHVVDQSLGVINGLATIASSDGSAKLKVTFGGQNPNVASDYWVLATDYISYAFVYSCTNLDQDYMSVASWKLSRTKELSSVAKTEIDKVISNHRVLDQSYFIGRDHTPEGCFYFPDPQLGMPVVFPGQCDDNIEAVPNFNMNIFQDTWHEIAGYPKANQDGQCISQQFTVTATNTMRLDSFSILDQTQSATEGHVTFANNDDLSGKLNINILVNGETQTIPYWVLSTDYTDYALVYSCVNINRDYRGVWSWKLSRTRQLSTEGNAAIIEAIAKVDVLRDEYYENIQQTDAACFHLPDITPGDNVVLPGRCDTNIVGMPNFNINEYSGEWRLIESYGSRYQSGTCNVAQYSPQADNVLGVTNSQVVNGQLASISGTATLSSTDGSGRLTFNLRNREYIMYILETDYNSFALAYGCTNLDNDQRRVTSWKFSRTNVLSQHATNRINEIINDIEVLHQPYYYPVNRSPDACFYFPEPDINTPVRFRGQCDDSIPAVPNFDVERYMGLWHDIESYPVVFQNGECPNAQYAQLDSNTVSVYNTHVVDQSLGVINGLATVASSDGSAKLKVTFGGQNVASDYWVLATDYISYAFVYSCANLDQDYMSVASWKLSRTKELSSVAKTEIDKVISDHRVLDQSYFIERDHTPEGCFYFPEPQLGMPVVFPGQCDDNIEAVPNFNMNIFQDTWHEIAGYPKANQDGQCISQQFTVTATNTMRLDSFSVLDQTQSATEGHVTFANNDDLSGKLNINILVNGETQTIPYWVLSTDYTDYALVYSCVNINRDYRGVWSWKLSRTRQLSAEGNAAIIEAIAKVDVLRDDYYENIQQTDAACFHLPDITPGDNVVLPGRCDTNIVGMPNFNINEYSGEWRLIESYGSRYQSGTCNVAQYSPQADNVLGVTNSQVVNGQLASISGTATLSSTDGSGRLTFNLRNREYIMYILETDYNSFALAYGCTNLDNDQRRVTSWKFSRTNVLSQHATNRINEIINDIEVLHQPYYYPVNRSPDACFYFPEPDINTPVRFRGQCDDSIPAVPNFDVERYMGLWHDIESYPVVFQNGECPNAQYAQLDSNTVSVYNTHVVDQSLGVINGLATVASSDGSAKLKVTFGGQNPNVASDYWVLATDYISYAFVYSCTNLNQDYMSVASWKLSRTKELSSAAKTEIDKIISNHRVLDQSYFIERDHTPEGCFYFPEPQPGMPVVFPGQCDDNIEAVPNFNMHNFQDTWHVIAGYPKANQDGQCISKEFAVTATNTMRLDSFSVLDQTQSATEGHVTFANDDDLSGKLIINILVNGETQTIPYWILSTDYTDYALVYSCININRDYRGVWSWKLSRSKELSNADNAAINDAIAKVDVLRNDYYENIQQTDTACFFFPELGPSDPVIFPGRCDPNIPVIQNFDASRYVGRWRLIESYYSDFQEGKCNAATYSLAEDGSLIVFNSKVVDEQLESITGSASLASDGSGKLIVTFPNSAPTEYWILDTDYNSYALIYTCLNLPYDQRRVWSWKMSRTNSLTQSATNAINERVNSVDVLDARYYQSIDRTEVDCFYYPTPDSTSNVIFPGQCDENIPVVPNFNANLYAGTWYDVESYPTKFQSGTCNTATYTVNADGTLSIQNTQVVNQLLQTVTGTAVPSTTDGSAKFDVTLTGSSGTAVTTKYWVLATDYTSYSFVYSCRNIDDEFREVYSWKLGKEPIIPEPAATTINGIIDSVQVLDQKYFVPRSHTSDACFYYPDNNGGDIVMNGQCIPDAEVLAVTNFNANAFSGIWHEVSRFPSALQNGECTATEFALNGANGFDVIQTSVIDEEQKSTVTQASVASSRGVISININGIPFNNVYILATDHTEYALLYSCRNLDADRKQLYSWKLSKTRTGLSEAANNAISEIVNTNIDLHEPYYRPTGQDHAACFYYPVLDQNPLSIELPGPCNETITGVLNFNIQNYLGTWYEVARYPQAAQTGQCNRAVYTADPDSGTITVVNSQITNEALAEISGEATVPGNNGYIEVTLNVGDELGTANYYVLATDYTSYAFLYSCVTIDSGERRRVGSWKLSRTTELSPQANTAIESVISTTQGLTEEYYQATSHTNAACFYYPVFEQPPPTIELLGPCDPTITGVANFNVDKFNGQWFEVARYPQPAQTGQCNLAEFENGATSGTLSFAVSEVISDSLSEIRGVATVTSSDGSGTLQVTFNGGGNQIYYVLTTDYTGYALLYICTDILDSNRRRVGSWKLSRNVELSEDSNNAINEVINDTQGLINEYYQNTSYTDEACFHYPEAIGDRVILPGQCDNDISAVESFNVARFANNSWYQIRRYDAVGDRSCVGTRLSFDENTRDIKVLSYEVVDEDLLTTEGSARISSDDGSGIFSLVSDDSEDGERAGTTIYILATDYDGYALAYSCVNVNSNQRQVAAWQLSRGRAMTEAGNDAIADLITTRPELHEPYFRPISHEGECLEPSSAFLFRNSIILIIVCTVLQLVW